jgi:hypothetical protein
MIDGQEICAKKGPKSRTSLSENLSREANTDFCTDRIIDKGESNVTEIGPGIHVFEDVLSEALLRERIINKHYTEVNTVAWPSVFVLKGEERRGFRKDLSAWRLEL